MKMVTLITLNIQSKVGFLNPDQIVIDSVTNLLLCLVDLRNSVIFNNG